MIIQYILVGIGGSFGATLRFAMNSWLNDATNASIFPFGTLAINASGCLIIGILFGAIANSFSISPRVRLLLITGFLGAFTTFSTFGYETFALIQDQRFLMALINILIQIIVGLFAVWIGHAISKILFRIKQVKN